jgi:hypothetical protein
MRLAEGADREGCEATRGHGAPVPVRRHRRSRPARRGAGRSTRLQAAGTTVPLHHSAGACCRTRQLNATRTVKMKVKTPFRDGTTHLAMGPLGFSLTILAAPANDCSAGSNTELRETAVSRGRAHTNLISAPQTRRSNRHPIQSTTMCVVAGQERGMLTVGSRVAQACCGTGEAARVMPAQRPLCRATRGGSAPPRSPCRPVGSRRRNRKAGPCASHPGAGAKRCPANRR